MALGQRVVGFSQKSPNTIQPQKAAKSRGKRGSIKGTPFLLSVLVGDASAPKKGKRTPKWDLEINVLKTNSLHTARAPIENFDILGALFLLFVSSSSSSSLSSSNAQLV